VCHVPGPRGNSLGYFCPSRALSQCFSQASGASRSQHRLSSFLLTKDGSRGCDAAVAMEVMRTVQRGPLFHGLSPELRIRHWVPDSLIESRIRLCGQRIRCGSKFRMLAFLVGFFLIPRPRVCLSQSVIISNLRYPGGRIPLRDERE